MKTMKLMSERLARVTVFGLCLFVAVFAAAQLFTTFGMMPDSVAPILLVCIMYDAIRIIVENIWKDVQKRYE